MTNTYNPTLPSNKDKVRRLVGDIASPWEFSDEEISFFLAENDQRLYGTAADLCEAWVAHNVLAKPTSYLRGGIQVTRTPGAMKEIAEMFRQRDLMSDGNFEVITEFAYDHFTLDRILADRALTSDE